ncbi:hypothetical protein BURK2_00193 [Burkholderiales bacterium]|nr:hypothetical protein BURK2_00193 [Burkholderiales bacterium]
MNPTPKASTINLHIDKLVLHGFSQINEAALTSALQEALSRELLAAPALHDTTMHRAQTNIMLPPRHDAHSLGNTLAQTCTGTAEPRKGRHG